MTLDCEIPCVSTKKVKKCVYWSAYSCIGVLSVSILLTLILSSLTITPPVRNQYLNEESSVVLQVNVCTNSNRTTLKLKNTLSHLLREITVQKLQKKWIRVSGFEDETLISVCPTEKCGDFADGKITEWKTESNNSMCVYILCCE